MSEFSGQISSMLSNAPVATGPSYGSRSPSPLQPQRMPRLCRAGQRSQCGEHQSGRVGGEVGEGVYGGGRVGGEVGERVYGGSSGSTQRW